MEDELVGRKSSSDDDAVTVIGVEQKRVENNSTRDEREMAVFRLTRLVRGFLGLNQLDARDERRLDSLIVS